MPDDETGSFGGHNRSLRGPQRETIGSPPRVIGSARLSAAGESQQISDQLIKFRAHGRGWFGERFSLLRCCFQILERRRGESRRQRRSLQPARLRAEPLFHYLLDRARKQPFTTHLRPVAVHRPRSTGCETD